MLIMESKNDVNLNSCLPLPCPSSCMYPFLDNFFGKSIFFVVFSILFFLSFSLLRQEVLANSKHLGTHVGRETVNLLAVLLNLLGVQHTLKSAGLLGKLE